MKLFQREPRDGEVLCVLQGLRAVILTPWNSSFLAWTQHVLVHSNPAVPASGPEGKYLWQSHLCLHRAHNKDRSTPVELVIVTAQQTAGFDCRNLDFLNVSIYCTWELYPSAHNYLCLWEGWDWNNKGREQDWDALSKQQENSHGAQDNAPCPSLWNIYQLPTYFF